jgi:hypothetical protein
VTTTDYTQHPAHPQWLPVGTDPDTGEAVALDLDRHPHIGVAGGPGEGSAAMLSLIAAHTAAHGAHVTIIDARDRDAFAHLRGIPGIDLHAGLTDTTIDALNAAYGEMRHRLEDQQPARGGTPAGRRRVIVLNGTNLVIRPGTGMETARATGAHVSAELIGRLIIDGGRAGFHLAADLNESTIGLFSAAASRGSTASGSIVAVRHKHRRLVPADDHLTYPALDPYDIGRANRLRVGYLINPARRGPLRTAALGPEQARALALRGATAVPSPAAAH